MLPEELLPRDLLAKASVHGEEFAWRRSDVPEVIFAAEQAGLATIGGQVQFRLPDGTCELYWLNYDASEKSATEPWADYVARSAHECLTQFQQISETTDCIREGLDAFEFLRQKNEIDDISKYLCFVIYFSMEHTLQH